MAAASTISARVRIHGRVQGVWFRAWTAEQAREMVARCHRGPPAARVERVEETSETEPVPDGFAQLPTG
jgi:acylphosphatase